jgi:hypothetical protein
MFVDLKTCKYYFLTSSNEHNIRRTHFKNDFEGLDITEINYLYDASKFKSMAIGYIKMLDQGLIDLKDQPFKPFILLEDDAKRNIRPDYLDIPDNSDWLYVGISKCGLTENRGWNNCVNYNIIDNTYIRVFNMLSTHGMMICSMRGANVLKEMLLNAYETNTPIDILFAEMQKNINAYALRKPLVYQYNKIGGCEFETNIEY